MLLTGRLASLRASAGPFLRASSGPFLNDIRWAYWRLGEAHNRSVRRPLCCAVVVELRSEGLVRDPRPVVGPYSAGTRNEKPQVSDEPRATGIQKRFRRQAESLRTDLE